MGISSTLGRLLRCPAGGRSPSSPSGPSCILGEPDCEGGTEQTSVLGTSCALTGLLSSDESGPASRSPASSDSSADLDLIHSPARSSEPISRRAKNSLRCVLTPQCARGSLGLGAEEARWCRGEEDRPEEAGAGRRGTVRVMVEVDMATGRCQSGALGVMAGLGRTRSRP